MLSYISGIFVFVVVSILIGIFILHKFKGHIKVWLFANFKFHPWDKVEENIDENDYDAFVSYFGADPDEHWVYNTLLPYLEAPQCGFHLCVHQRDFVPGVTISKNIATAIKYSRRTIVVLSPNFLQSGWCDFEFQNAHRRVLEDKSNYLIIILLEQVNINKIDKAFKFYLETRTYLDVKDKKFWDKLLYCMPTVPIDKLKAVQKQAQNDGANAQVPHMEVEALMEPGPRENMIADLPPLFRRIHVYHEWERKKRMEERQNPTRQGQEDVEEHKDEDENEETVEMVIVV